MEIKGYISMRFLFQYLWKANVIKKTIPIITEQHNSNCVDVKSRNFAKETEYASTKEVKSFDKAAITRNLLNETAPMPAPTQMISSGRTGMINKSARMTVSFFLTYS